MRSALRYSMLRQLISLGVFAIHQDDQTIVIWSPTLIPNALLFEARNQFETTHCRDVSVTMQDLDDKPSCGRCGQPCDVLYIDGHWHCSACDSITNDRKLAAQEYLVHLTRPKP